MARLPQLFLLLATALAWAILDEEDSAGEGQQPAAGQADRFHFYSHHKAGTALSHSLFWNMLAVKNPSHRRKIRHQAVKFMSVWPVDSEWNVTSIICPQLGRRITVTYEDMRVPSLRLITEHCPNRAIHMIRNAQSQIVSNYVYTKHLEPGDDLPNDVALGALLRKRSMRWGLERMCDRQFRAYYPQMLQMHEYLNAHKPENILEIQYEDFETDFDETVRRMFKHFLGDEDHQAIELIVRRSAASNPDNWDKDRRHKHHHISSRAEKQQVRQYLLNITEDSEQDSCFRKISEVSLALGYDAEGYVVPPQVRAMMSKEAQRQWRAQT